MVPCSHFSVRIRLCLKRQRKRSVLSYIVSFGNLFLPSYLSCWLVARNGEPVIAVAAIEATTQLLTKGSSFEHQKLLKADVFPVALTLYDRRSQRQHSLKLLRAIISQLSHAILADDGLAREMFSLFE